MLARNKTNKSIYCGGGARGYPDRALMRINLNYSNENQSQ